MISHVCRLNAFLWLIAGLVTAGERLAEDFDATWQEGRWAFSNGPEFPGARGRFERSKEAAHGADWGGRLEFDFAGGGNYVAAILRLDGAPDIAAVRVWVKKPPGHRLTFRYTDPTGQTLQRGFDALDDRWTDAFIPMTGWTGHWGGANDGVVHGPPRQIAFLIENAARKQGALLFDDVRLIEGKPTRGAGMVTSEYVGAGFTADEGWHAVGPKGATSLDGRTWRFDFSHGAASVGIIPKDYSLLGLPQELRIRVRGQAPGHPVRLQLSTHFMGFEKTVSLPKVSHRPLPKVSHLREGMPETPRPEDPAEYPPEGVEPSGGGVVPVTEIVVAAPPGEGWRWFGGENDGKLHGPLRLRGIFLDAAGKQDAGQLELIEIRVKTACAPDRCCVLMAESRRSDKGIVFVATARNLAPQPAEATITQTIRDWPGKVVATTQSRLTLPANGVPVETPADLPVADQRFLEAEFILEAPGQLVPPARAYHVAPIEHRGSAELDPASPFGMGLYLYRYGGDPASLAEMDRAAQMGQDAGVKWSREEFHWARIEPAKGQLDWSFYDAMVATAKRHGITLYGLLAYWAPWAKAYTPEGIDDYCRFAAAAAERYRADIQHWEVWNEPNIFFWQGPSDLYADLLKKSYDAIKKANPNALVLGCSTAGIDHGFIRRTMELGAPFDILTIHPYRENLDDRRFIAELRQVADLAKRPDGALRPVWITEMGWATHVPHNAMGQDFRVTTQRDQATLLARSYLDAILSRVAPNISWYDFRNDGTDAFNFEHNMGIVTRDFRPKPAYRAFATLTRLLRGKRPQSALDLGPSIMAHRFADANGQASVLVLWSTEGDRTATLPSDRPITLIDLMGGEEPLAAADGKVAVPLREGAPVFILALP